MHIPFTPSAYSHSQVTEAYEILSDKERRVLYDFGGIGAARKGVQEQVQIAVYMYLACCNVFAYAMRPIALGASARRARVCRSMCNVLSCSM